MSSTRIPEWIEIDTGFGREVAAGAGVGRSRLDRRSLLRGAGACLAGLAVAGRAVARAKTQRLFVITRTKNANVVHYSARISTSGSVDEQEPLVAYWEMKAEDGRREGLTWLERQLGYGFEIVGRVEQNGFRVRLVAFGEREIAVVRTASGGYRPELSIARERAVLQRIHATSVESGLIPSVSHVDVFGVSVATGKPVKERLKR